VVDATAQAIDFRREALGPEAQLGAGTAPVYELVRRHVPFLEHDAEMYPYIEAVRELVSGRQVARVVAAALAGRGHQTTNEINRKTSK
jgi:histidine ammonia-lyase